MLNLFGKRRVLFIDKGDLTRLFVVLDKYDLTASDLANIKFGNCGWKVLPNAWFIHITLNDKYWYKILKDLAKEDIKLISETERYKEGD